MKQSNCCGAGNWLESGICEQCKEHAEFEYWDEAEQRVQPVFQNDNDGYKYKTFNDKVAEFWRNVKVLNR